MCLIPEVRFQLDGPCGLLAYLEQLLESQGHAVVCVAEGAGQDLIPSPSGAPHTDPSGNPILKDIGGFLKTEIKRHFSGGTGIFNSGGGAAGDSSAVPAGPAAATAAAAATAPAGPPSVDLKYLDPTYMLRAVPANSLDNIYCKVSGPAGRPAAG